ncbi:MAG: L-fucose/L-arabinose isomerase family protein [Gemmatimonadota bacterium]|nr:L-fucose/L-arabinose isomerase family protein [Gemmatimonadota bacterium]HEU4990822.1 L-fucose/L-arabinose isomerase family protein [Gemmatimonadaceae bacterium]
MPLHQLQTKTSVRKAAERAAAARKAAAERPAPRPKRLTVGLLVGNRGFFPGHLAREGRDQMLAVLKEEGFDVVALGPNATRYGAVESRDEAKACAELFKQHREKIAGVVVTLPNFGDERGVAETLRMAGLHVPVLIHAAADDPKKMLIDNRRDAFCGKMSVCNVLTQYGIPYSLTTRHTVAPTDDGFRMDLRRFAGVCRVVRGLRTARIGAIGARPAAFKTVRYSEKILEAQGIAVEPIDLSEILGRVERLRDGDRAVKRKRAQMDAYVETGGVPEAALVKMAKLGAVVDAWMKEADVTVSAVQCWTSLEEYFGVVPCTLMSMMSNDLMPSACEVDVCGTVSMYALSLASQTPAALLDWNNNYGDDPNKAVCFHCSNLPKAFFESERMDYQEIIAGTVGRENTYGTIVGKVKASPMTFARFSTDDRTGKMRGYVGEGRFTKDPLTTFGGAGVVEIPNLQALLRYICEQGFEHHVASTLDTVAGVLHEATTRYLGWDTVRHA